MEKCLLEPPHIIKHLYVIYTSPSFHVIDNLISYWGLIWHEDIFHEKREVMHVQISYSYTNIWCERYNKLCIEKLEKFCRRDYGGHFNPHIYLSHFQASLLLLGGFKLKYSFQDKYLNFSQVVLNHLVITSVVCI